jgi:hypothetical protein
MRRLIVPAGSAVSQVVDLGPYRMCAIKPPATLDTNSARIYFLGSLDGTTFGAVEDNASTLYTVTVSTTNTEWLEVDASPLHAYRYVKIVIIVAQATTTVPQSVNRIFTYTVDRTEGRN